MADRDVLAETYPFKSHFLDLGGVRMHYLDEGTGPTVLLLHGNPTWSYYYRNLIIGLRDQYRVIVPDHIGCGLSDKPKHYQYRLVKHISNLERFIDSLELDDLAMAVHDWGGAIGLGWARRHPEKLRAITLFNTAAFPGPCPLRIRVCAWPLLGGLLVRGLNGFVRGALVMASRKRERMTANVRRGYLLPYKTISRRFGIHGFVRDIPFSERSSTFRLISEIDGSLEQWASTPVLICWGGQDFCFNGWFLQQWRSRFPKANVHVFPDAGHFIVEDAHEEILPLMREFLSKYLSR